MTLRRSFQQSAIISVTLTLTFRSLSIPEVNFLKHGGVRPSYRAKAMADEILVSHLTETVTLIRQNHLTNLLTAAENGFLLRL